MANDLTPEETLQKITELLTNTEIQITNFFNIFFNPTPMDVTLTQYDDNGVLQTYTIPNRAKDREIAVVGNGKPEGVVVAPQGTIYIDQLASHVYVKVQGNTATGWIDITPSGVTFEKETFEISTGKSTESIELLYKITEQNRLTVYRNALLEPFRNYYCGTNSNIVYFIEPLNVGDLIEVSYFTGDLQVYQGYAGTIQVGTTTASAPGSNPSVTNSGTMTAAVFDFVLPRGEQGPAGSVSVGTTTTGNAGTNASVTNSGTASNAVLNFTIPQGIKGDKGDTGTIQVGTTTTGNAGTNASVTNSGTSTDATFNFTIPYHLYL